MLETFCVAAIPCFELFFKTSIVNKAIVWCCRYRIKYHTLSDTLTIQRAGWFWFEITSAIIIVICFVQHFIVTFLDDNPHWWYSNNSPSKYLHCKPYGICGFWGSASSQAWWAMFTFWLYCSLSNVNFLFLFFSILLNIASFKRYWWKMFTIFECSFIYMFNFPELFLIAAKILDSIVNHWATAWCFCGVD